MNYILRNYPEKLTGNSIKYLYNISNEIPVPTALKSHYSTKYRLLEEKNKLHLISHKNNFKSRCFRCCIKFSEGSTSYRIKPQSKLNKFTKKVLKKSKSNKVLTSYQRQYLKKVQYHEGNQLEITCSFCKKESLIPLDKIKKDKIDVNANSTAQQSKAKKKRKNKDKLCGLNKEAVLSSAVRKNKSNGIVPLLQNENKTKASPIKEIKIKCEPIDIEVVDLTKKSKKKKKKKKKYPDNNVVCQKNTNTQMKKGTESSDLTNIISENKITKRKRAKNNKKNKRKLKNIVNQVCKTDKASNKLNNFLQCLN